jgi:hypothetical protein
VALDSILISSRLDLSQGQPLLLANYQRLCNFGVGRPVRNKASDTYRGLQETGLFAPTPHNHEK